MATRYKTPENWIQEYLQPRHPELVEPFRRAGKITEVALQTENLADSDLGILLEHATSGKAILSDNVGDMLGKLANTFPSAQQALETMAQSKKVSTRAQALASLLFVPPCPLHERVYTATLKDRSKKIRRLAAHNIRLQGMAVLLPALTHAVACETDADTCQHMQYNLALLQDGYWQERIDPDTIRITCCSKGSTWSRVFSNDQFETAGRAWLETKVAEWKKHWYLP